MDGSEKPRLTVLSVSREERWSGIILHGLDSVCATLRHWADKVSLGPHISGKAAAVSDAERQRFTRDAVDRLSQGIRKAIGDGCNFSTAWQIDGQRLSFGVKHTNQSETYLVELIMSFKPVEPEGYEISPDAMEQILAEDLKLARGLRSIEVKIDLQPAGDGFRIDMVPLIQRLRFIRDQYCVQYAKILELMIPDGWQGAKPVPLVKCEAGFQLTLSFENLGPRYAATGEELWSCPEPTVLAGPIKSYQVGSLFIFQKPRAVFTIENMEGRPHCRDPVLDLETIEEMLLMADEVEESFTE